MPAQLKIEHECPQCGAAATLEETDRLFCCQFCRVRSYLITSGVRCYVLPPRAQNPPPLYVPYWRFRGTLVTCLSPGIESRTLDASTLAIAGEEFPSSLGLRTQVFRLRFTVASTPGRFVRPTVGVPEGVHRVAARLQHPRPRAEGHHEFIREELSLIFAPFHIEGRVRDAIAGRARSEPVPLDFTSQLVTGGPPRWQLTFVPALCPHCGWDLEGQREARTLLCPNCASAWQPHGRHLESVPFAILPGDASTSCYLPFWRLRADVRGIEIATYADLVRVANLPKVAHPSWRTRPFHFWIPAFHVRPEVFLSLARTLSLRQPEEEPEEQVPDHPTHAVTVARREASRMIKVVLASLMRPPATMQTDVAAVRLRSHEALLTYVPFAESASEYAHHGYGIAVQKTALQVRLWNENL